MAWKHKAEQLKADGVAQRLFIGCLEVLTAITALAFFLSSAIDAACIYVFAYWNLRFVLRSVIPSPVDECEACGKRFRCNFKSLEPKGYLIPSDVLICLQKKLLLLSFAFLMADCSQHNPPPFHLLDHSETFDMLVPESTLDIHVRSKKTNRLKVWVFFL